MEDVAARLRRAIEDYWPTDRPSVWQFQKVMDRFPELRGRGTSYASIRRYLAGEAEPSITFLERAAEVTRVRPEWLIAGQGGATEGETAAMAGVSEASENVAEGVSLRPGIRRRAQEVLSEEFIAFDRLPPLAQGHIWRTYQRLLTPMTFRETHEEAATAAEELAVPVARRLGQALASVSDAFATEFQGRPHPAGWSLGALDGLRLGQVEAYVLGVCQAAVALIPNPWAGEARF